MAIEQFKFEITPLEKERIYRSSAIDVTDYILDADDLYRQVDDGDFDIGVFTFDNMRMRMFNGGNDITTSGRFYDNNSASSIFKLKRDLAKVEICFLDNQSTETCVFLGLLNDTLTKDNFDRGYSDFIVTGLAGIFSKYSVVGGSVADGMTISQALKSLLDRPFITDYLNYSDANINPALDIVIDVGSELDNLSYKAALDKLMLASGSVFIVDGSNNMIVKDRSDNGNSAYNFYNSGDPQGRVNILGMKNYNTGVQRAFNLYEIDKTISKNDNLIEEYGLRKKAINVDDIITSLDTRQQITDYYLTNFSVPKQELEIDLEFNQGKDVELLDLCTLDYKPVATNDNPDRPYSFPDNTPTILNKRSISGNIGFKVIAKRMNIENYTITLKLRETGKEAGDSII